MNFAPLDSPEEYSRFIEAGLDLRFQSIGRPPQNHYPTYRDLLLETDSAGNHANYLASEESFQFIKQLHDSSTISDASNPPTDPSSSARSSTGLRWLGCGKDPRAHRSCSRRVSSSTGSPAAGTGDTTS